MDSSPKMFNPIISILFMIILFSCQKKEKDFNYDSISNSPPMSDPQIHLLVLNESTEMNRFDLRDSNYWTIDQVKTEQIKSSGELIPPVQKSEVISTGKGQMLVLITSPIFADEEGISKIKVNWPDKSSDIFGVQFADGDKSQRIIKVYMNQEIIWPEPNNSRTFAIIEK